MQDEKSQQINKRFFEAYDYLTEIGKIKNPFRFCKEHEIHRSSFIRLRNEPEREFQLRFLTILVEEFGISAKWLLTGEGAMTSKRLVPYDLPRQ